MPNLYILREQKNKLIIFKMHKLDQERKGRKTFEKLKIYELKNYEKNPVFSHYFYIRI